MELGRSKGSAGGPGLLREGPARFADVGVALQSMVTPSAPQPKHSIAEDRVASQAGQELRSDDDDDDDDEFIVVGKTYKQQY